MIYGEIYTFGEVTEKQIIYQKKYCGTEGSCSFIMSPLIATENNTIIQIGDIHINCEQTLKVTKLYINKLPDLNIEIDNSYIYFIVFRWSKALNYVELSAFKYVHNEKIPQYKLSDAHYWFDMDNPVQQNIRKFNIELIQESKGDVQLNSFVGWITNIKLFDVYNDNLEKGIMSKKSEYLMKYDDKLRKIVDLNGVSLK